VESIRSAVEEAPRYLTKHPEAAAATDAAATPSVRKAFVFVSRARRES